MKRIICGLIILFSLHSGANVPTQAVEQPAKVAAITGGATALSIVLSAVGYKIYTMKSNSTIFDINNASILAVENRHAYIPKEIIKGLHKNVCPYIPKSTQQSKNIDISGTSIGRIAQEVNSIVPVLENRNICLPLVDQCTNTTEPDYDIPEIIIESTSANDTDSTCAKLNFFKKLWCYGRKSDYWVYAHLSPNMKNFSDFIEYLIPTKIKEWIKSCDEDCKL